ncbi:MAG: hypothetical protein ABSA58_10855 [Acetobacteraceae bacterium]
MEYFLGECFPAVIVYGLDDAVAALAKAAAAKGAAAKGAADRTGVTLLSAPGAALHAGCGWWRALVAEARAAHPEVPCTDILDCADNGSSVVDPIAATPVPRPLKRDKYPRHGRA